MGGTSVRVRVGVRVRARVSVTWYAHLSFGHHMPIVRVWDLAVRAFGYG